MTLRRKQSEFACDIAKLILWASERGYEVTFGYAYRSPKVAEYFGFRNSNHTRRLAVDLNLFWEGKYLTETEDHRPLGEHWESLRPGNVWGGRFNDGNHYAREHNGVR